MCRGVAIYERERYDYALGYYAVHSESWSKLEDHINLEIHKGSQEFLVVKATHLFASENEHASMECDMVLRTPSKNEYSLKNEVKYAYRSGSGELKSDTMLNLPSSQTNMGFEAAMKNIGDEIYNFEVCIFF